MRASLSAGLLAARRRAGVSGTALIEQHDAAAGRAAAALVRADVAAQLAMAAERAPRAALDAAVERCPSVAKSFRPGMRSPRIRTALRSGDISGWDLDRQLAVAASLGLRARLVLEPA